MKGQRSCGRTHWHLWSIPDISVPANYCQVVLFWGPYTYQTVNRWFRGDHCKDTTDLQRLGLDWYGSQCCHQGSRLASCLYSYTNIISLQSNVYSTTKIDKVENLKPTNIDIIILLYILDIWRKRESIVWLNWKLWKAWSHFVLLQWHKTLHSIYYTSVHVVRDNID